MRDVRIAQIYEGTNGVQAQDLAGRKVVRNRGVSVQRYVEEVRALLASMKNEPELDVFTRPLARALERLQEATESLLQQAAQDADAGGAAAVDYLHLFGLTIYAHMWALMAKAAQPHRGEDAFYADKLRLGVYFMERMLPEVDQRLAAVQAGATTMMSFADAYF